MIALAIIGGYVAGALTVVGWAVCRAGGLADRQQGWVDAYYHCEGEALEEEEP